MVRVWPSAGAGNPEQVRARRTHAVRGVLSCSGLSVVVLMLAACFNHDPARPSGLRAGLALSATVAVGEQLAVDVFYLRTQAPDVALAQSKFAVTGSGPQQYNMSVDVAPCLADPARQASSVSGGCRLALVVRLEDANGRTLDSVRTAPFDAAPGAPVLAPPVTLRPAGSLTVVAGASQVGWASSDLVAPVVVLLADATGQPIADRAVTLSAVSGGGAPAPGSERMMTASNGRATVVYRLGSPLGAQSFRVSSELGTAGVTVNATAVRAATSTISASVLNSCAIRQAGPLCWGDNRLRQLGNPAVAVDSTLPVPVSTGQTFVAIAGTVANSSDSRAYCGQTSDGQLYCWGANHQGELGVSTAGNVACLGINSTNTSTCVATPTRVSGIPALRMARLGGGPTEYGVRTCGVTLAGDLYCWGENALGAVGDSSTTLRPTPTRVLASRKWISVATGHSTTCAVDSAGQVFCWGRGSVGELGDGLNANSLAPVPITSTERFQDVGVGAQFACGLTFGQEIHCWGRDHGTSANFVLPRPTNPGLRFQRISVGLTTVCGVTITAEVWCEGGNVFGMVGDGSTVSRPTFVRVDLPSTAIEVSAGVQHTCALLGSNELYCWGRGANGQLGYGQRADVWRPTRVNFTQAAPGAPARLEAYSPTQLDSVSRGSATSGPTVRVLDANGIPVVDATIRWNASAGSSVGQTITATGAEGLARTDTWRTSSTPGVNTLTATSLDIAGQPSVAFTLRGVVPGPASRMTCLPAFVCSAPQSLPVNSFAGDGSGSVTMAVTDAAGLVVSGVPVAITGNGTGNRTTPVLPTTLVTNADGFATLNGWRLDTQSRTDTITFTATSLSGSPARAIATGAPLSASQLRAQFPASAIAGLPLTPAPTVAVTDAFGNVVSSVAPLITLSLGNGPAGGTLVGSLAATPVNGVASFPNVTPTVAGNYTIVSASPGLVSAMPAFSASGIVVTPASAIRVVFDTLQLATTFVGVAPGGVTYLSANPAIATVGAPSGRVFTLAPGTTTITATYVPDQRIRFSVLLTVVSVPPPTISIQSIISASTGLPVNASNVIGSINVTLNVQANQNVITSRALYLDGISVVQSPTGSVLALNTAATVPATGKLQFCNGPHTLSGRVFWQGGPAAGASTGFVNLGFNNNGTC